MTFQACRYYAISRFVVGLNYEYIYMYVEYHTAVNAAFVPSSIYV